MSEGENELDVVIKIGKDIEFKIGSITGREELPWLLKEFAEDSIQVLKELEIEEEIFGDDDPQFVEPDYD